MCIFLVHTQILIYKFIIHCHFNTTNTYANVHMYAVKNIGILVYAYQHILHTTIEDASHTYIISEEHTN